MNRKPRIGQEQLRNSILVLLAWALLTAWVALPQTAFASQDQENADVGHGPQVMDHRPRVNEQEVSDQRPAASDQRQRTEDQPAFTYQGQLKDSSGPVNGPYDLQFSLYSVQAGGEKLDCLHIENLALTNGLFSVELDFGYADLESHESWLEVGVRPGGMTESYIVLSPRQKLTPTPYAIFAQHEQWSLIGVPVGFAERVSVDLNPSPVAGDNTNEGAPRTQDKGQSIPSTHPSTPELNPQQSPVTGSGTVGQIPLWTGTTTLGNSSLFQNAEGKLSTNNQFLRAHLSVFPGEAGDATAALWAESGAQSGAAIKATNTGDGNAVEGTAFRTGAGVAGINFMDGVGASGRSQGGVGVKGISTSGSGVEGQSTSGRGVLGESQSGVGVTGRSQSAPGVAGFSDSGVGVGGRSMNNSGTLGQSTSGIGVEGQSESGAGVQGSGNPGVKGQGTGSGPGVQGTGNPGVLGQSTNSVGVEGRSQSADAVFGNSSSGRGVHGKSGSTHGVFGESTNGPGVSGQSISGIGIAGTSENRFGVFGDSAGFVGVGGTSTSAYGVQGVSETERGVIGFSTSNAGVQGESQSSVGVAGFSTTSFGVQGVSNGGFGLAGFSTTSRGVYGQSEQSGGVVGRSERGTGVAGVTNTTDPSIAAVYGGCAARNCNAGVFDGNLAVRGMLLAANKLFRIDHPLDPANKYLNHASVESSEMMNLYNGIVTLDARGEAVVQLPAWFEALNSEFRYQLTCMGGFAPVYIAEKIQNHRFKIAGGSPGLEVSWQVTGVRQDAWANAHPIVVEEDKSDHERGYYLDPELFGEPDEKSLRWLRDPDLMKELKQRKQAEPTEQGRPHAPAVLRAEPFK